ncbi:potassium channel family protein [Bacteriovorax sp. DB6_IX]|uniref:potassium channel family protein n=1 Tax=Bacteriovorax sp. DB6_IX TaxID=1353530 RepID=UPI000389E0C7|nr:potassium channel family protein [Bacteriovorax sp. DB6_IX]EQC52824.1 ion channel [Bacteriovorax sp. DB6_IX]
MDTDIVIFFKRIYGLLVSFPFWMLTFLCNVLVFLSSLAFYKLEYGHNLEVDQFIDAVWWSFSTITTVGYGDITPVTFWGRVLGILLMIVGTGFFVSYTALFANAMLGREVSRLGRRVSLIKKNVQGMQYDLHEDELVLERQVNHLNHTLARLEKRLNDLDNNDKKGKRDIND